MLEITKNIRVFLNSSNKKALACFIFLIVGFVIAIVVILNVQSPSEQKAAQRKPVSVSVKIQKPIHKADFVLWQEHWVLIRSVENKDLFTIKPFHEAGRIRRKDIDSLISRTDSAAWSKVAEEILLAQ